MKEAQRRSWGAWLTGVARSDVAIASMLGLGYLLCLLASVNDLGYARDEGFYFVAAKSYLEWFKLLFEDPEAAFLAERVDQYWKANHEHPVFIKSLFALSYHFLHEKWRVFAEAGTAFRFPGMLLSSLAVSLVYRWGARILGRLPALVAAVSFACMPRIFYHSHLDCFDMPVAAMWLLTTYVYWCSLSRPGWLWPILSGVCYGLLLNTKHNSWLLPGALVLHTLLIRGPEIWRGLRRARIVAIPPALFAMATIGPLVFYATWPWIWADTPERLREYADFHLGHVYYNMEFLGRTYWEPPMPRLYAWVMTLGTVPGITLLLFGLGVVVSLIQPLRWAFERLGVWSSFARGAAAWLGTRTYQEDRDSWLERRAALWLWLLSVALSYAPWWLSKTPIFGGTKHWITAYPYMALFAGVGFELVSKRLSAVLGESGWRRRLAGIGLAASVVAAPFAMTVTSHPWGLSAYTPLVGGASGAATLGLNRSFWGYTTGALQDEINELAKPKAKVFVHDTAMASWNMMVQDGRLRSDLRGSVSVEGTDLALYHYEPHMGRVEYMIWVDYGTVKPVVVGTHDGVPVVWMYQR